MNERVKPCPECGGERAAVLFNSTFTNLNTPADRQKGYYKVDHTPLAALICTHCSSVFLYPKEPEKVKLPEGTIYEQLVSPEEEKEQ